MGSNVGVTVGAAVESTVGIREGDRVERNVGSQVGRLVGIAVVGKALGRKVGC